MRSKSERGYTEQTLSTCLDRIVSGEWTVSDCLEHYPEEATGMWELLTLASALQKTRQQIKPRTTFRLGESARLLERLEKSARPPAATKVSLWDKVGERLTQIMGGHRLAFAGAAMALVLALFTLGGLVAAADAAGPGDALYGVDLAVESARVRLTTDPAQMASLRMSFAEERLDEADRLARQGDAARFEEAVFGYGAEVAAVTAAIREGAVNDGPTLDVVNQTMADQEGRLDGIFATATGADDGESASGMVCADESAGFMHPIVASLVAQYGLDDEVVAGWFCDGYGLGEIMLALTTAQETDMTPEEVLMLKSNVVGWGQVWQMEDVGFPEPPGQQTEPPGLQTEPPGQQGEPPGLQDEPSGQEDEPPGQQNEPPGQQNEPPGQQNEPPGQQNEPPGQQNEPPDGGRPDNPPGGGRP